MKSFLARLAALEASRRQDPLIILCEDVDGNTAKMTVQEVLDTGRGFVRVVSGSRLADLDDLLSVYHEIAISERGKK